MNKILFLHTSHAKGGAELSLIELLLKLSNRDLDLHLVFSSPASFDLEKQLPFIVHHPLFLVYPCSQSSVKKWLELLYVVFIGAFQVYRLAKKERFSTVYCNTVRTLPYCVFLKFFTSIRIICHCRDNVHGRTERLFIRFIANKCVAVSTYIARQLPDDIEKHVVYNGVDLSYFHPYNYNGWLKQEYQLDATIICIGNVGQIVSWKNQTDFLKVARRLLNVNPDLHFFIVGEAVDEVCFARLRKQVEQDGMERKVTFTGPVDSVKRYLAGFDVVVHTAKGEPFGRILIEAAALSKPMVAYACGGPLEIIEDNETGYLVSPGM